ncbi:MAG: hypothetical protein CL927_10600 [Deltaproteobacteria bacterium]|nr:hypothetical protein [Deltaproteobacteria bacterium]HCH61239.1 hypothetical protein [Deltaproteobacteria bacterium]
MSRPWRPSPLPPRLTAVDGVLRLISPLLPYVHPSLTHQIWGHPVENDRGEPLDEQTHLLLSLDAATAAALPSVARRRENMRRGIALIDGPKIPVYELVETLLDGDLRARVYRPSARRGLPWMLYLHGGGWVTGDLDSHDRTCRRLCAEGNVVVIAIDYRLAPEAPFPAAVLDAERAWTYLCRTVAHWGGDPDRGSVGGDSAGGNLAAVLCQRIRDGACNGGTPVMQLLVYPVTDFRRLDTSHRTFARGFLLTAESIDFYKALYAAPDDNDPMVSPLRHPKLHNLPPALLITAGFDPLRNEGERFVHALRNSGTPTGWMEGAGLIHGFLQMDQAVPAAGRLVAAMVQAASDMMRTGTVPPLLASADPPCRALAE